LFSNATCTAILRLPSTAGNVDALRASADGVQEWKNKLGRGLLPSANTPWPDDPIFREALLDALVGLSLPGVINWLSSWLSVIMAAILAVMLAVILAAILAAMLAVILAVINWWFLLQNNL
jgi:hypothetical protein